MTSEQFKKFDFKEPSDVTVMFTDGMEYSILSDGVEIDTMYGHVVFLYKGNVSLYVAGSQFRCFLVNGPYDPEPDAE